MKTMKQQPQKHIRNQRFTQTYQYSPPYHLSHHNSLDLKSQTVNISSPKQNKNLDVNLNIQPASNNQHIVDLYDDLSNNGDITVVDDADLQPLALYVRESKQRATLKKNFDQADNLGDLLISIKGEITSRSKSAQDQLNTQRTIYEAEDIKNMNEEMQITHAQQLQEFDDETNQLINETISNQLCEKNSFEYNWENTKTTKYRKPSTSLLQMKEIEKSAIIAGDVPKARQMHAEIEKQTQKEADEQIQKFNNDYTKMKSRLLVKQQQEMERIRQNREELRQIIVTRQELDKEVYEKRVNVINNKDSTTKQIKSTSSEPGTEIYGCSLFHIMQETQFGIDPLLPELSVQKSKTGPSIHSKNSKNASNPNKLSRPNSMASTKRGASVQIGNYNLKRFKWTLAPSNDPKYRTKTDDTKLKKKDNFKYVKKPQFNKKFDLLLNSSPQKEKKSTNNQLQNSKLDNQKYENTQKEGTNNYFSNSNSIENNNMSNSKIESYQKRKYSASNTDEIKFSLDDDIKDDEINIEIKSDKV